MPATQYTLTDAANPQWSQAGVAIPQEWSDIERHYNILTRVTKELFAIVNGTDAGGDLGDYTNNGLIDRLYLLEETNNVKNSADFTIGALLASAGNRSIKFWQGNPGSNFVQLLYHQASNYFKFQNQAATAVRVKGANASESDDFITKGQVDAAFAALTIFTEGNIMETASSSADSKWTFCDGKALSRTTYANLFNNIGTTYGVGNGTTTFNVPDLRGRLRVGPDNLGGSSANRVLDSSADTIGGTMGAETMTLSSSQLPAMRPAMKIGATGSGSRNNWVPSGGNGAINSNSNFVLDISSTIDPLGSGANISLMQPTMAIPVMIYTGV